MEYNPFTQDYNRLRRDLDCKNNDKRALVDELKRFDATDVSSLFYSLKEKEKSKNDCKSLIDDIEKKIEILNTYIQRTKKRIKTRFNPFNWFDADQKTQRKKLNEFKKELSTKQEHKERELKSLAATEDSINIISSNIKKYENFDRQKVSNEVNKLDKEIFLLEEEFKKTSDSKNNVDIALRPIMEQINEYESRISNARRIISEAQSFERKLDAANNSYERATIHKKCDNTFGEGSPQKIIKKQEGLIRKFERDLEKTKERAIQIGRKSSRVIKKIVIDGNNMCYQDNKFVGLDPLIKSSIELQNRYEVIIVFDSAIRSQVKATDQTIRAKFNNSIQVHVVATKQKADETILDIASSDDSCYILSNDRFGEYTEKEVVRENRLIRHEIVEGKVIIHDLNINVRYG